jgi:triphosphoribosyl-dephospho-CoA synthase
MTAAQFLASAAAAAPALCATGASIGQRILGAVEASLAAAHCNTNLGIVLLCAPVASALESLDEAAAVESLRRALQGKLQALTVDDAANAFRAISLAHPGGLGTTDEQDVHREPTVDLRAAMALAAERDLVARQYATDYADLFETGLVAWHRLLAGDRNAHHRAMQCVFLTFLARFPDSHIVRKHGLAAAQATSDEAGRWLKRLLADGGAAQADLAKWDARLKSSGINPGTSADLAVATVFVAEVLASCSGDVASLAG